jgi:hypothetical protein
MSRRNLEDMTLQELIDFFAQNGIEQDEVISAGKVSKFKKIFGVMAAIDAELTRRGPQARMALAALYAHPNMQVRLQAALVAANVDPIGVRPVLEAIAKSARMPQAADAREALRDLNAHDVSSH